MVGLIGLFEVILFLENMDDWTDIILVWLVIVFIKLPSIYKG